MKTVVALLLFCFCLTSIAQNITAKELLDKSINYHDPSDNWKTFKGKFKVVMTTPNSPKRTSLIRLDILDQFFSIKATKDTVTTVYSIIKGNCYMVYNGKNVDSVAAKEKNMSCDKAELYKNYYSYLYGLPIKLRDPGTNLSDTVEKRTFKGKNYLVLKVTYDEAVGSDVWYFYFNPNTYAMEVYQFFKTDANDNVKPESGEYILLTEETLIEGIKMPKIRAWYYNKDDTYLGTDTLFEI